MLPLDDELWSKLSHAYGRADDVPKMLKQLQKDGTSWEPIWGSLIHQGDVHSASYAAVPHITAMAEQRRPEDQSPYLQFVASVACSANAEPCPSELETWYKNALQRARTMVMHLLHLPKKTESEIISLLQSLAGIDGQLILGNVMEGLADGAELEVECPHCYETISLTPNYQGLTVFGVDFEPNTETDTAGQRPVKEWKYIAEFADELGHGRVSRMIRQVYSEIPCPLCGENLYLPAALADYYCLN